MELEFLGTSSGVPTKQRNVSAIALVESQGSAWYLVDCGEGTQQQILRTRLSLNALEAIFITHVHGDHCYGLPGLLASAGMNGRTKALRIVAPDPIKAWFEATQAHTQLHLPYELEFITSAGGYSFELGQFFISITELSHRVPSYAYSFTESKQEMSLDIAKLNSLNIPQGPLWGQLKKGKDVVYQGRKLLSEDVTRPGNKPRKAIICGDNDTPELLRDACEGVDVLVHEATYTEDMRIKAQEAGHSYAKRVALFAEEQSIPNLVLTHFSPRYQSASDASLSIEGLREEARTYYSGNLILAEDFRRCHLDKTGRIKDC